MKHNTLQTNTPSAADKWFTLITEKYFTNEAPPCLLENVYQEKLKIPSRFYFRTQQIVIIYLCQRIVRNIVVSWADPAARENDIA